MLSHVRNWIASVSTYIQKHVNLHWCTNLYTHKDTHTNIHTHTHARTTHLPKLKITKTLTHTRTPCHQYYLRLSPNSWLPRSRQPWAVRNHRNGSRKHDLVTWGNIQNTKHECRIRNTGYRVQILIFSVFWFLQCLLKWFFLFVVIRLSFRKTSC